MSVIINGTSGISTDGGSELFGSGSIGGSLTLTSGTANGVTYLNGSKVLTSGSALTTNGSSLGVGSSDFGGAGSINVSVGVAGTTTGGLQLWSTTTGQHYVQFGDGTAGAATYAGAIGYSHATDQMFFYANGSEAMRLTSTGLGIGTSSPSRKLTVAGDVLMTSASDLQFIMSKSGVGAFDIYNKGTTGTEVGTQDPYPLLLKTNNTVKATLDTSGNLGLGVTPSSSTTAQFQIGRGVVNAISNYTTLGDNATFDGSWKYIASTGASLYQQNTSAHAWYTAPSGTAGNAISFTQAMTLDASGRLGIGTSSPSSPLSIRSFGATGRAADFNGSDVLFDGAGQFDLIIGDGGVAYMSLTTTDNATALKVRNFSGNSDIAVFERTTGNVGIGTSSPANKLHTLSGSATATVAKFAATNYGNAGTTYIEIGTQYGDGGSRIGNINPSGNLGTLVFETMTGTSGVFAERLRIDSSGNVGIGVSNPSSYQSAANKLVVGSTSSSSGITIVAGTSAYSSLHFADGTSGADSYRGDIAYSHADNSMLFFTDGSERARINSSGNLLVGTTSASSPFDGCKIAIDANSSDGIRLRSGGVAMRFIATSTSTFVGSITTTGSATAYNTSSDYRLKEDWVAVADASTRVNALNPVNFAWKVDGTRVDGFLAHELAEVVPEAVTGKKDAVDAEGNPVYQGIDQSKLVPLLTAALQEALAKIESLTARVSALEGN